MIPRLRSVRPLLWWSLFALLLAACDNGGAGPTAPADDPAGRKPAAADEADGHPQLTEIDTLKEGEPFPWRWYVEGPEHVWIAMTEPERFDSGSLQIGDATIGLLSSRHPLRNFANHLADHDFADGTYPIRVNWLRSGGVGRFEPHAVTFNNGVPSVPKSYRMTLEELRRLARKTDVSTEMLPH